MIKTSSILITISFIISTKIFAASTANILKNQDELFKKLFPTSSFKDYKTFKAEVEQKHPKSAEKILNKAIVVIAAPSEARLSICSQGFKNLHQTSTSRGFTNKRKRLRVEASLLNIQYTDYKHTYHTIKPKYGFITTREQLSLTMRTGFPYGEDFYVLDLKQTQDRITWTPGDSLNRAYNFFSRSINYKCHKPSCWEQIFIPWKYRLLIIPYLTEPDNGLLSIKNSKFITPSIDSMNPIFGSNCSSCYIEAQIFGELNLSHISALVSSQRPDFKSLQYLYKAKVKVFDIDSIHISEIAPESPTAIGFENAKLHIGDQAKLKSKFLKRSKSKVKILKFFPNGKTLVSKNGKKKYVDTNLLSK